MLDAYPRWAGALARKYLSKTINQFILHGNVHDLVPVNDGGKWSFQRLRSFLSSELFASRDIVIYYDRASGIHFRDKESMTDFNRAVSGYDSLMGTEYAGRVPKDPVRAFTLLENYFRTRISDGKGIALIIDYTETIVPSSESGSSSTEDRNALVFLQRWSHDPMLLAADFSTILITENLADLHRNLVQNPYSYAIKVEIPDETMRQAFIQSFFLNKPYENTVEVSLEVLTHQTAGLNFVHLQTLLSHAVENGQKITYESLNASKKELIEAEAYGLLEFVSSRFNLDAVAGHKYAKQRLREASLALKNGRHEVMPMGYLVCGPVGTGKTFLVTSFAQEVGIPMVKLKNFRSQWQGVTEGNLEKILTILKAMSPVAVMIDEADAYLGDRNSSGDSGVSSRVFAQIAQFMSNTDHRGKIVWFLMTARPDFMPVDLKRQGRAEEHIALFHPNTAEERIELFETMKRKTKLTLTDETFIPAVVREGTKHFSGADMEAALTRAKFKAAAQGLEIPTPEILDAVLDDFLPPTYPEEIELQTLCAVMECTSKELLPEKYRDMDRAEINDRIELLRTMVG
jgi:AAA+ superfamily predicted ATPase